MPPSSINDDTAGTESMKISKSENKRQTRKNANFNFVEYKTIKIFYFKNLPTCFTSFIDD